MKPAVKGLSIKQFEESDAATLRRLWVDVKGSTPPTTFTARRMRLALAWEVQAASTGGEPVGTQRKWTRLLKEWGGTTHEVLMTADGGASWKGQNYSSLSAVARAMTGTNRNGPKFFGLREQEKT